MLMLQTKPKIKFLKMTKRKKDNSQIVSIVMGSKSDWPTMKHTAKILKSLNIKYETKIVSAHRTPKRLFDYSINAKKIILVLSLQVQVDLHTYLE